MGHDVVAALIGDIDVGPEEHIIFDDDAFETRFGRGFVDVGPSEGDPGIQFDAVPNPCFRVDHDPKAAVGNFEISADRYGARQFDPQKFEG